MKNELSKFEDGYELTLSLPVPMIARLLEADYRLWGGGIGVERVPTSGEFVLTFVNEEGVDAKHCYNSAQAAIWAFFQRLDGDGFMTLTPPGDRRERRQLVGPARTIPVKRCAYIVDNYTNEICGCELPCPRHP